MPQASPAQFRPSRAVTFTRVGAGRTERRERKWSVPPSSTKAMGRTHRDAESADFRVLQRIATTAATPASDKVTFGGGTRDLTMCSPTRHCSQTVGSGCGIHRVPVVRVWTDVAIALC
jgi:hypothetical protein